MSRRTHLSFLVPAFLSVFVAIACSTTDVPLGSDKKNVTCASLGGACRSITGASCASFSQAKVDDCGVGTGCCIEFLDATVDSSARDSATDTAVDDASDSAVDETDATLDAANDSSTDGGDGGKIDCVVAGGTCVGLTPGACDGGSFGPYDCGPGVGVGCCLP